jgi:hypothetical protein
MFDLPFILTHPLLKRIFARCADLKEEAEALAEGSPERARIEKRLSQLEEYGLPKPDRRDMQQTRPVVNEYGRVVGQLYSVRRRLKEVRRGRPAEYTLQVRAALEDKLANPRFTWEQLASLYSDASKGFPHKFKDGRDLQRAVRRLKAILRREGIKLPIRSDYPKSS